MNNDLYCKIFIDTNLSYEELFSIIIKYINGKKEAVTYIATGYPY